MRFLRTVIQLLFLEFILYVGIVAFFSGSQTSCESYCPFGIVATAIPTLSSGNLYCSMTELNVAMLLGLLTLTLVAGRAFCAWACPFGAVSEWLGGLGKKMGIAHSLPEGRTGALLLSLKFVVLAAILYFTTVAGDLVFRTYCPYFTLFSFHGHEVEVISYFVLANLLLAGLVFPLFWCRVLCPLHAVLGVVGKTPNLRIHRVEDACADCNLCSKVCPEQIDVAHCTTVTDGSCSRCLACVERCPKDSLVLGITPERRAPWWILPILVVGLLVGATYLAPWLRTPTLDHDFDAPAGSKTRQASLIVDGIRCRGTATALQRLISEGGGLARLVVYAGSREVQVWYLSDQVAAEELIFRFDRDIEVRGQTLHPFHCLRYKDGADGEWVVLQEEGGEISYEEHVKETDHER